MDEPHPYPDIVSHKQIVERFKKLFGRDMTPKERKVFFLSDDDPPLAEKKKARPGI
jgi:hypothetical protein